MHRAKLDVRTNKKLKRFISLYAVGTGFCDRSISIATYILAYPTREATKTKEKPVIPRRPIISFIFLLHADPRAMADDKNQVSLYNRSCQTKIPAKI